MKDVLTQEDEQKIVLAIKEYIEANLPPSQRMRALHCVNELRRMIELEKSAAIHAIVMMSKAMSVARVIDDKVLIVPGGNKR